jgi:hypothetical protein
MHHEYFEDANTVSRAVFMAFGIATAVLSGTGQVLGLANQQKVSLQLPDTATLEVYQH